MPVGQWVHLAIETRLGRAGDGTWDLVVTLPEQAPQRFDKLPLGNPDFNRLTWVGFVSNADAKSTFYLDNISLQQLAE